MKIILLMILIAKFKIKPRKKEEKFKEQLKYFIKFMDEKLKTIFGREHHKSVTLFLPSFLDSYSASSALFTTDSSLSVF